MSRRRALVEAVFSTVKRKLSARPADVFSRSASQALLLHLTCNLCRQEFVWCFSDSYAAVNFGIISRSRCLVNLSMVLTRASGGSLCTM